MDDYYRVLEKEVARIKKEDKERCDKKGICSFQTDATRRSCLSARGKTLWLTAMELVVQTHAHIKVKILSPTSRGKVREFSSHGFDEIEREREGTLV